MPSWGRATSFRLARHSASRAFHSTGMSAIPMQNAYFGTPYWEPPPHFALRAILPPAPSTAQECKHFQCKTNTLALLIGGRATSFRLAHHSAFRAFHSTGL